MTGANRLLVGLAWPLMVFLHWMKDGHRAINLAPANAAEIGFLMLASLYAFVMHQSQHYADRFRRSGCDLRRLCLEGPQFAKDRQPR